MERLGSDGASLISQTYRVWEYFTQQGPDSLSSSSLLFRLFTSCHLLPCNASISRGTRVITSIYIIFAFTPSQVAQAILALIDDENESIYEVPTDMLMCKRYTCTRISHKHSNKPARHRLGNELTC